MSFWASLADLLLNVPPFKIIDPDEGGARIKGGKYREVVGPGFYWKWPVYETIRDIKIKEQVKVLPIQDIGDWHIRGEIAFEITDPHKAILGVYDPDESLRNLAMTTIASYVSRVKNCTYDGLVSEVLEELETASEDWGIEILSFGLPTFVQAKVYRLIGETPVVPEK